MKHYIITSIFDPYSLVVKSLMKKLEEAGIAPELLNVEELKFIDYKIDLEPGLCYFISSGEVAKTMGILLGLNGFKIVNADYIQHGFENKILALATLASSDIPVLKSFFSYPITTILGEQSVKDSLPLYHKPFSHMETLTPLEDYSSSLNFLRKKTNELSYLETKVKIPKTLKAYVVNGEIFYYKDSSKFKSDSFEKNLLKTIQVLKLDVASIDFVPVGDKNYIIDVNHAPAFGGNDLAFNAFVNFIKENNGEG